MVGVQGFEPWTLCSQSRCATRLRYTPIESVGRQALRVSTPLRYLKQYAGTLPVDPYNSVCSGFSTAGLFRVQSLYIYTSHRQRAHFRNLSFPERDMRFNGSKCKTGLLSYHLFPSCRMSWSRRQDSNLHNLGPKPSDQPLTHVEIWMRRVDSNHRSPGYEPGEIDHFSTSQ